MIREIRRWAILEIENEGDILDIVLESPHDLDNLKFKWSELSFDMGHDGLAGPMSDMMLNSCMENITSSLTSLSKLDLTLFPTPLDFRTLDALITTPAGQYLASQLRELTFHASHPSHLTKLSELLVHTRQLQTLNLEHLQIPNPHSHHLVVK